MKQRIHIDTREWEKVHREKVLAKAQKVQALRALVEEWESRPDQVDREYLLELRTRLHRTETQLQNMKI